jgi:predicted nucleic acid-binding protein
MVPVVDANVLIYAADADSQFHSRCRQWFDPKRARPSKPC